MADFWEQQELQQEVAGQGIPQNTPMLVAVRARPLSRDEAERGEFGIVRVLESRVVVVLDPQDYDRNLQPNRSKEKKYAFDYVFDEDASQAEIFSGTTRGLINGVLVGFNASVFAYGATGAGKTYTMLGALDSPGVMVLTLNDLYRRMRSDPQYADSDFKVRLSYLEIYNEVIKDLLNPTDSSIGLPLNEDPVRGMVVAGITEYDATSASEILQLLHHGNMARAQEPTAANRTSSRSHAILQVSVERSERTAHVVGQVTCGKLSLIDLAGSERASKTENTGLRLKEGANINRSLLALGNCINALADGRSHVPYRDSKMTRLLKDSLGGNCRTVMIANISPASTQFEETLNSLKYANRAKNLKTKVTSNVQTVAAHIADYQRIILSLRAEITQLKATVASQAQHGGGAPLGAPSAAVADAQRERALAAQADEAERQTARALEASIAKVCAERRKLAQQLDSVHGALINQAAAAQAQTAADGTAAPPAADPALAATAAAIVGRLGQSEHVARQLLHAIDERISDADRAAALRTLFHAHFLDLARAHAAYELAVRQSYEDSVAAARDLPPRVQRAVGRLLEWRELRASTQPHRDFDQRMARLELPPLAPAPPATYRHDGAQLGGAGGGGADAGDSNSSSHVASDEALLALPIAAQQPSAPSRGHSSGSVAAALNVLHSHPPGQRLTPGESPRARRARPSNASGRESPVQGAGARVAMPPASGASRLPVLSPGGGARHVAQHPDGPHQAQQQPRRALVQRGGSRRASLGASQPAYPTVSPQALRRLPGGGSRALSREASPRAPRRSMFAVDAADGGSPTRSEVNSAPYYVPAAPALAPSVTGAYASGSGGGGGISAARALNNPRALVLPPQQPQTAAIAYTGAPLRAHPLANWPNDPTHDELSDEGTHLAIGSHVDFDGGDAQHQHSQPTLPTAAELPVVRQPNRRRSQGDVAGQQQRGGLGGPAHGSHAENGAVGAPRRAPADGKGGGALASVAVSGSVAMSGLQQPRGALLLRQQAQPAGSRGGSTTGYSRQPQPPAHIQASVAGGTHGGRMVARQPLGAPSQGAFVRNPSRTSLVNAGNRPAHANPTGIAQSVAARRVVQAYSTPVAPKGQGVPRPGQYGHARGALRSGIPTLVSK